MGAECVDTACGEKMSVEHGLLGTSGYAVRREIQSGSPQAKKVGHQRHSVTGSAISLPDFVTVGSILYE